MLASEEPPLITAIQLLWLGLLPAPAGEPPDPRARLSLTIGGQRRDFEVEVSKTASRAARGEPERWRLGLRPNGPAFDLARRPFHRSPGRWHLCCPGCGRWRAALALAPPCGAAPLPDTSAGLNGAIWACRECLDLPPPAQRLSASQRVFRAVERAEYAGHRQPGERRDRWLRRQAKAITATANAAALLGG